MLGVRYTADASLTHPSVCYEHRWACPTPHWVFPTHPEVFQTLLIGMSTTPVRVPSGRGCVSKRLGARVVRSQLGVRVVRS